MFVTSALISLSGCPDSLWPGLVQRCPAAPAHARAVTGTLARCPASTTKVLTLAFSRRLHDQLPRCGNVNNIYIWYLNGVLIYPRFHWLWFTMQHIISSLSLFLYDTTMISLHKSKRGYLPLNRSPRILSRICRNWETAFFTIESADADVWKWR